MSVVTERLTQLKSADMNSLCEATEAAITDGIGFTWATPPAREVLESYWRGVLVVPDRMLFGARLDGVLSGSVQLVMPPASKQTMAFAASVSHLFVAPWARGHGMAKALLEAVEAQARENRFTVLNLTVRETQEAALRLYAEHGYEQWGIHPAHERLDGRMVAGHFFYKRLDAA